MLINTVQPSSANPAPQSFSRDSSLPDVRGRPIIRALDILCALNARSYATLLELYQDTGLPKPTIHRILGTLQQQGYVARDPVRGIYHLTARVQLLSAGFTERCQITEVGADILRRVTQEIRWPLALGTLDGLEMVVRYSTMPFSPWAVRSTTVNNHHKLLSSAMGLAYLSACRDQELDVLLELISQGEDETALQAHDRAHVEQLIDETRSRGFGLRKATPKSDSTSIAVPIVLAEHVVGVVSMTMFQHSLTPKAIKRYPPILKTIAATIAKKMESELGQTT